MTDHDALVDEFQQAVMSGHEMPLPAIRAVRAGHNTNPSRPDYIFLREYVRAWNEVADEHGLPRINTMGDGGTAEQDPNAILMVSDLLAEIEQAIAAGMDPERARVVVRVQTEPAVYRRGFGVRAKYSVAPLRKAFRGGRSPESSLTLEGIHLGFLDGNETAFAQWKKDPARRTRPDTSDTA